MPGSSAVVVTGALTAIVQAAATAFAVRGEVVVVSDCFDDAGEQLARDLKSVGAPDAMFVRADVRFARDIEDLVLTTVDCFGRLDVAVNSAGTERPFVPIVGLSPTLYAEMFGTNVLGTLLSMKHDSRVMQRQGSGVIVNVTSVFGANGSCNAALYVASRHAVIGLTHTAVLEASAFGVRVNAVRSGSIDTATLQRVGSGASDTMPLGRAGESEEVADAIVFTASRHTLTGQTLCFDGGEY